jgi:hypothetical protein
MVFSEAVRGNIYEIKTYECECYGNVFDSCKSVFTFLTGGDSLEKNRIRSELQSRESYSSKGTKC